MTRAIQQSVTFRASPSELFAIYTNSRKHSAATGVPAKVSGKAGAKFTAFNRALRGRNLIVVRDRMIVQAWRASHWKNSDQDSILVLTFNPSADGRRGGGRIDLVHVNVPEHDHKGVTRGWPMYYWRPWRDFLARKAGRR